MKKLLLYLVISAIWINFSNAQVRYPYVIGGFGGGMKPVQAQTEGGTIGHIALSNNPIASKKWESASGSTSRFLSGFVSNMLYFQFAFDNPLDASKGYHADYIELKWELVRYEDKVTRFKIFRKEVGKPNEDFEQVALVDPNTRLWKDEYAEAGVLYDYKLYAAGIYEISELGFLNTIEGTGFRLPFGRVTGNVTYEGGASVKDVQIIASTEDDFFGSSLELDGANYLFVRCDEEPNFEFDTALTFQAWFKPKSVNGSEVCLFEKTNAYKLTYSPGPETNHFVFTAGKSNKVSVDLFVDTRVDTFFHVTAMRSSDSLHLMVKYDEDSTYQASSYYASSDIDLNGNLSIGASIDQSSKFIGNVDEIRIWNRSFEYKENDILSGMYISGTEDNLVAYYRLNEKVGDEFYDLSRKGYNYNEVHGKVVSGAIWSDSIPRSDQLAIKGITDENGNYQIAGMPYSTDGSIYTLTPVYGTHKFDPKSLNVLMAHGNNIHNNKDFFRCGIFLGRWSCFL